MMVERWFMEEYLKMHRDAQDRRLQMQGPAHHQGSRSLTGYKQASHSDQACSDFQAWCMAHKDKATSDVSFNLEDPPEAYTNRASTPASVSTLRWRGCSMGQTTIRAPRTSMERPS